jgi:hypothetical protein
MLRHPPTPIHLLLVDPAGALGRRLGTHLVERPAQVDRRGPRRDESLVGGVYVLPARRGERVAVGRGDPDRGGAADGQRANRLGDLGRRLEPELDRLLREPALVKEDDRVVFEPDDVVGL